MRNAAPLLGAVIILQFTLLSSGAEPTTREATESKEATEILDKVRDSYANLRSFHFERSTSIVRTDADGKSTTVADLSFVTATDSADGGSKSKLMPVPLNLEHVRMEFSGKRGKLLLVSGGQATFLYSSRDQQYVRGDKWIDVVGSVPGAMFAQLHVFPFTTLAEGNLRDVKLVREEEIDIGKARRQCYVIEGKLPPYNPLMHTVKLLSNLAKAAAKGEIDGSTVATTDFVGVEGFLMVLEAQGILGDHGVVDKPPDSFVYSAIRMTPDGNVKLGDPTRLLLWIDKDKHVIVRSTMNAKPYWYATESQLANDQPQEVRLTERDEFTVIEANSPLPDKLFEFTPPAGAKEVTKGRIGQAPE